MIPVAVPARIREYLDGAGVRYEVLHHRKGYTARAAALDLGIPAEHLAKTVVVSAGDRTVLASVPASCRVDLEKLASALGEERPTLVPESSFRHLFADCEIGTTPPLGGAYGMGVIVDKRLPGLEQITFQAGSHKDAIRMPWEDFARLENPERVDFACLAPPRDEDP